MLFLKLKKCIAKVEKEIEQPEKTILKVPAKASEGSKASGERKKKEKKVEVPKVSEVKPSEGKKKNNKGFPKGSLPKGGTKKEVSEGNNNKEISIDELFLKSKKQNKKLIDDTSSSYDSDM